MTIAEDKLFGLVNSCELDGRTGSHPLDVRGFSTMNCYLLCEDDRALLIGTGYSVHQSALLAQLDELVGDRVLSLLIPRVEFAAMCNARPIADRFRVDVAYQRALVAPSLLLNFRPGHVEGATDGLREVELGVIRTGESIAIDPAGDRELRLLLPDLRLLPCSWAYDPDTKTLFTGDVFSWVWRDTPAGPWLLAGGGDDDPSTPARVEHFLVENRYWWLAGSDTQQLRRALAELFERLDIETVAPDHGCVLRGDAVQRHYQLLDDFLAVAPTLASVGVAAGRWTKGGTS